MNDFDSIPIIGRTNPETTSVPVAAGRVLGLVADSNLVLQDGYLLRISGRTPLASASAYLDPVIWNSRHYHNAIPYMFAQLAGKLGIPADKLDAIDWFSELVPNTAEDSMSGVSAPPPETLNPGSRTVFAPIGDIKVGQRIRLDATTPDGNTVMTYVHPTLWNLGDEDHYAAARRAALAMLGIDADDPARAADAAAVTWSASVVEFEDDAASPAVEPEPAAELAPAAAEPADLTLTMNVNPYQGSSATQQAAGRDLVAAMVGEQALGWLGPR